MTSRLNLAAPAVRPALKGRLLLAAPSGAGKTKSGLIIATVLAADEDGSIVVIDTEKESALTYADDFDFKHIPWRPPYDVAELAETITDAGRAFSVVMVDSMSHFWRKSGGTLDVAGGKFGGWKKARPLQEDLVDAILGCDAHVILCARSKQAHVQEEDERGRQVVKKLGMAAQQDDDLEYEMNIGCEIDMEHTIAVSKSRCDAVPVGRQFTAGHAGELAELYRDWLKVGEPPAPQAMVDALVARMNALPAEARKACKGEFVAKLGRPELLREARLDEASRLVARFEAEGPHPDGPPSGQGPGPEPGPPPDTSGGEVDVLQGSATSASPPEISEPAPAPGSDDGTREGSNGGSAATASPAAVTHEDPTQGGGDDDSARKGSPGTQPAAAGPGQSSSEAESEPPPARQGAGEAAASSAPSGTTLKEINPSGYNSLVRYCRGKKAEYFSPDEAVANAQWEALAWASSGGRTTRVRDLDPEEAGEFRRRVGDLANGRGRWVETDDPKFLGWDIAIGEDR